MFGRKARIAAAAAAAVSLALVATGCAPSDNGGEGDGANLTRRTIDQRRLVSHHAMLDAEHLGIRSARHQSRAIVGERDRPRVPVGQRRVKLRQLTGPPDRDPPLIVDGGHRAVRRDRELPDRCDVRQRAKEAAAGHRPDPHDAFVTSRRDLTAVPREGERADRPLMAAQRVNARET